MVASPLFIRHTTVVAARSSDTTFAHAPRSYRRLQGFLRRARQCCRRFANGPVPNRPAHGLAGRGGAKTAEPTPTKPPSTRGFAIVSENGTQVRAVRNGGARAAAKEWPKAGHVEEQLYEGFLPDSDRILMDPREYETMRKSRRPDHPVCGLHSPRCAGRFGAIGTGRCQACGGSEWQSALSSDIDKIVNQRL
jgi:hypothetical protein